MNPLMQGIRDIKFNPDHNTYEELAKNYKDEGNFHFKSKKYRLAVANYTEGLRLKIPGKCKHRTVRIQIPNVSGI